MSADEMITITVKEYEQLLSIELHMGILEARGVDNWEWYCGVPLRDDYKTEDEYLNALQQAYDGTDDW